MELAASAGPIPLGMDLLVTVTVDFIHRVTRVLPVRPTLPGMAGFVPVLQITSQSTMSVSYFRPILSTTELPSSATLTSF
jgi:hypothetical protein